MTPHLPLRSLARRKTLLPAALITASLLALPSGAMAKVKVGTPGPDTLRAGSGGDTLWGGGGADTLYGGAGPDLLYGVRSNNKIYGRGGNDYIEGGAGSDTIDGGPGNNTILGSSGQDKIVSGDGNNYVDVGGGNDHLKLGNGNNVILTGSGGGTFVAGNGNNTVYYGSGIAYITLGNGENTIYLSATSGVRSLKCGGNPNTHVYVNQASLGQYSLQIFTRDKAHGCKNIETYDGAKRTVAKIAGTWEDFNLRGGDGRDKLFGGHGGGTIDAGEGDNEVWADHLEDTGLPNSGTKTTRITVGNGNNRIFGGRGINYIEAGNGANFVRGGVTFNEIRVGSGDNQIRLQGSSSQNSVTITGAPTGQGSYVESLANGAKPKINCVGGAKATVVYGNTKPDTNCRPLVSARSKKGKDLQLTLTPGVPGSDPLFEDQLEAGETGIGVPRPNGSA